MTLCSLNGAEEIALNAGVLAWVAPQVDGESEGAQLGVSLQGDARLGALVLAGLDDLVD
ncbi:hypothetical protein [Phaeobacter sp. NW0010-22]|uniref:hypothetical protein n=1 Tax=Phaeobacter sp. NW0010-22 TaxID=3135907 RepID=UPI00310C0EEF